MKSKLLPHASQDASKLNEQEERFVDHYLKSFDFEKAWIRATGHTQYSPYQIHSRAKALFLRPQVSKAIVERLEATIMSKVEVLWRLTEQARGMHALYINEDGTVDLARMEEDGRTHLIKSIRKTRYGLAYEFNDPLKALELMGRYFKLFTDRVEVANPVTVRVVYEDPIEELDYPEGENDDN